MGYKNDNESLAKKPPVFLACDQRLPVFFWKCRNDPKDNRRENDELGDGDDLRRNFSLGQHIFKKQKPRWSMQWSTEVQTNSNFLYTDRQSTD
jgi:hypothetical protein